MKVLTKHFNIIIEDQELEAIIHGPVFTSHSKTRASFDATVRESDRAEGQKLHAEEIEKVHAWSVIVAQNANIPLELP